MGFYAPAQIVRDAREYGVEVRPVCINESRWDCTLEPTDDDSRFPVRLGPRMVKGLGKAEAAHVLSCCQDRPFVSIDDLWRRARIHAAAPVELTEADAFRPSLGLARRGRSGLSNRYAAALREAGVLPDQAEPSVSLRSMASGREVVEYYSHVGLTFRQHPVSFPRAKLTGRRI